MKYYDMAVVLCKLYDHERDHMTVLKEKYWLYENYSY